MYFSALDLKTAAALHLFGINKYKLSVQADGKQITRVFVDFGIFRSHPPSLVSLSAFTKPILHQVFQAAGPVPRHLQERSFATLPSVERWEHLRIEYEILSVCSFMFIDDYTCVYICVCIVDIHTYRHTYLSICLFIYLTIYLPINLFIYQFFYLFIYIYIYICTDLCLSIYLYLSISI